MGALLAAVSVATALAGMPTKSGPATQLEATLAREGGDGVVLLGNSKVTTDLDLARLRQLLGPGAPTVAPANVYGTSAPVWYAVLKNRVYANGHRPKLLVVFAPLETALTTDLPNEAARAVLAAQIEEDEPVLSAKVYGGALDAEVRERLRRVLLPACHADRPPKGPVPAPAPTNADLAPDRSFVAEILALTEAHGTPTLFVRAPFGPSRHEQDDVPPETVAATVAFLRAHGAGWVDLSEGAPETAFGDGVHMNVAGRRRMTDALAEVLRPVLSGGALPVEAPVDAAPAPPATSALDLLAGTARYAAPPPALPPMPAVPSPVAPSLRVDLPVGLPGDETTFAQSGRGRCVPLQLLRGGVPVDDLDVLPTTRGVHISSPTCVPVDTAGLSWRLDPERTCRGREGPRWLYPGDTLTLSAPVASPLAAARGRRLDLGGSIVGPDDPDATYTIEVRAGKRTLGRQTGPLARFLDDPPSLPLADGAVRGDVEVRITTSATHTWLLLTSVVLADSTTPAFHTWAPR